MPIQDTSGLKEKIISVIKQRGPSLPVHIAKETGLSILFASAFLSELLSEKKIKMSHMRVGSSAIYYLSGQESKLEQFSIHLGSKEKEAFGILQNKKILRDKEQFPAIRVALQAIKDFAIPFKKEEEIYWRYFLEQEPKEKTQEEKILEPEKQNINNQIPKQENKIEKKELGIFEKKEKRKTQKKKPTKTNEKFFNKVKEYLASKNEEILDIILYNKSELILKVKNEEEYLLVAYNKKRLGEDEIIKAHKKSEEVGLKYKVIGLGEPLKKVKEFIVAVGSLKGIENINDNL